MKLATCIGLALALSFVGCRSQPERVGEGPANAAIEGAARIEIRLQGIRSDAGSGPIRIALWPDQVRFMRDGAWTRGLTVPIGAAEEIAVIEGVAPGRYAVSAFHDVTDCGEFRRGAFGLPRDPWAVSNGGPAWLPPSWSRAAFDVPPGSTRIVLDFGHQEGSGR